MPLTRADWYRNESDRQSDSRLANTQSVDRFADNGNQEHTSDNGDSIVQGSGMYRARQAEW
jgi:hypothetical protein